MHLSPVLHQASHACWSRNCRHGSHKVLGRGQYLTDVDDNCAAEAFTGTMAVAVAVAVAMAMAFTVAVAMEAEHTGSHNAPPSGQRENGTAILRADHADWAGPGCVFPNLITRVGTAGRPAEVVSSH